MPSVQENYERTMKAEHIENTYDEDVGCGCRVCSCKTDPYTLSNSEINEIHEKSREIATRKGLTNEQAEDAFVVALIDAGCHADEADEICELFVRTEGEVFNDGDDDMEDDDTPPDEDEDFDEEYEEEDDTPIIEV